MKKFYLQLTVFLLSYFFSVVCAMAQITTINGVIQTEVEVKEGKLTIYLPDDIRTGDVISGTVTAAPKGTTEKESTRNSAALNKYVVNVAGAAFTPVAGRIQPIKFIMAAGTKVSVLNNKSAEVSSFPVSVTAGISTAANAITVPSHALTGAPFRIRGNFDGDISNTGCFVNGKSMDVLAESPRQTICSMPQTASGQHTITVTEKGITTDKKISAVNMDLSATKTNLRRGESSFVTLTVTGLQGISSNTSITLTNTSPSTISVSGGNTQTILITPSQVSNNGTYTQTINLQSIATGAFTLNADLHLPQTIAVNQTKKGPCDEKTQLYEAKKDSCKKKNCDKELEALNGAKQNVANAEQAVSDAQKALDDWNKANGAELDALSKNMGNLQTTALNAANNLAAAKQALLTGLKQALQSGPGKNDGLAFSGDQLTGSRSHYTEVYSGIYINSHNPFNKDPKNVRDNYVKNQLNNKLSGNSTVANLLKVYQNAIAANAAASNALNTADAMREALNAAKMVLINALNNAKALLARALADIEAKEAAYKNCLKEAVKICREVEELKLRVDSCIKIQEQITKASTGISGSPANPQNGNPAGSSSAQGIDKANAELDKANEALNSGDYSGAGKHAANADQQRKQADKMKEMENSYKKLLDSLASLKARLQAAMNGYPDDYSKIQQMISQLESAIKAMQSAINNNNADAAGRSNQDAANAIEQITNATNKAVADAEKARKQREEYVRNNTPKPKPILAQPVNPDDRQLKMFARTMVLEKLYRDEAIKRGGCDCTVMALGLANKTNQAAAEAIGNIGVGVAFAPLEAFPGFSLGTRLGIGTAKAIGSALYAGQKFPEELAKNLFNVIGGEIFPELLGSQFLGNRANELASGGLDAIMQNSGIRTMQWGGKTTLDRCGKIEVSGKTTLLFNPNTGWVTLIIKLDGCDGLTVVKYKVNADGIPVNNTTSVSTIK